jgi:hexosaminidase
MKTLRAALLVVSLFLTGGASAHDLMPVPAAMQFNAGRLAVDKTFTVALSGHTDERLRGAVDRTLRRLEGRTVLELPRAPASDPAQATLLIAVQGPGAKIASVDEDESYTLDVAGSQAVLKAATSVGALRGLETVLQLLAADRDGFYLPAVSIQDRPRFRWRGLLIDSARHFQPLDVIRRNLDAMAAVKLNVLHWHLSDNQGFRIESKRYPKLHGLGSDGNYYTQDEVRGVIAYAQARGIRVLPEFDMPGHSTSWLVGYPELGSAPGPYAIERKPGIMDPTLDPTREEVYRFLDRFLGEMAALFPDAYLHIGGDENEGKHWAANPRIQAFMQAHGLKDKHALQTYFNRRLQKIVQKHGKRMMGWDEIFQPDLPKDVVVHSWRGSKALAEAARQGYDGVLSNGYYIDLIHPASVHYLNDPLPESEALSAEQARHVLGGEATMWSEFVSPETIDSRIWPRTAAIAERLWSPREVRDIDDMYRRLEVVGIRLEELGLTHLKNRGMLLRRLAGRQDTHALEGLLAVVEPVKAYQRHRVRPQTVLAPLTGLVDAAGPDAPDARALPRLVDALLGDVEHVRVHAPALGGLFVRWHGVAEALHAQLDDAPALAEARPLERDLADLAVIGDGAVGRLGGAQPATLEWRDAALKRLADIALPKAGLEFPFLQSMRELVVAAYEKPQATTMTPQAWRDRVRTLATPAKK